MVATSTLLKNQLLDFLSDVDVIVFSPFFGLLVKGVAVVVSTFSTALVDQKRV